MIKTVLTGSADSGANAFAFDEPVAAIVPLHKAGVDSKWLTKRAAAAVFEFDKIDGKPGETLVHLLALGDGETVGCNRNGDYFPKKANQDYHQTFMKAHYFHHHNNKDPKDAFGRVVAAAHNPRMGRVELIVAIDDDKAADDLAELEKKGEFPVSMSCRVPYDICSICGNKAKTRSEYCKHASLAMCRIMDDGKQAYVINDQPDFFDISKVWRGADRVAWTFQKLQKAASDGGTLGGAELAELLDIVDLAAPTVKSAYADDKERVWEAMATMDFSKFANYSSAVRRGEVADDVIASLKSARDTGAVFNALHQAGICLPLISFLKLANISTPAGVKNSAIRKRLRTLMTRRGKLDAAARARVTENSAYDGTPAAVSSKVAAAIAGLSADFGLFPENAYSRGVANIARDGLRAVALNKEAADSAVANVAADEYAAYLLAFASKNKGSEHAEFVRNLTTLCALD